ncbi:hypothetical protein GS928_23465 [Rhodococcus hoagii]|nr:hypothetical protein [Prescottella equi]
MKIAALWIAAALSAGIAVGQAVLIVHRIVVDPHRRRDVAVSSATLWGEVVDR